MGENIPSFGVSQWRNRMWRKAGRLSRRAAGNKGTGNGKWESEKMEKSEL